MSQSLNIQEIAIAIAAKQYNPTILTPDFLKYSGIVPSEFGQAPVQAAMRFNYTLEGAQMSLDINQGGLQLPDQTVRPIVLFTATFNHPIVQEEQSQRLAALSEVISNWRTDIEAYKELVNTKFLNSPYQLNLVPNQSVIPAVTTF